jgi:hypothetical protein
VVISTDSGIVTSEVTLLKSAVLSNYEIKQEQFMAAWCGQGLDYAHDTVRSQHNLNSVFAVFYGTFLEEK